MTTLTKVLKGMTELTVWGESYAVFTYQIVINKIVQYCILKNAFKSFAENGSKTNRTVVFST